MTKIKLTGGNNVKEAYHQDYAASPRIGCCDYSRNDTSNNGHSKSMFSASFEQYVTSADNELNNEKQQHHRERNDEVLMSDVIGGFGIYQLLVLLFSGLREAAVGYDAVVVSIITQPERDFVCADKGQIVGKEIVSTNSDSMRKLNNSQFPTQCFQHDSGILLKDIDDNSRLCESFLFNNANNNRSLTSTLVTEWNLVCQREYLLALTECAFFIGMVLGNIIWGYTADLIGRWRAYLIGHVIAIIFGWASVFATSVEMFILFRAITAIGSISYNIIYTIQVEIIGTKYRSYCTILNHFGWGTGVLLVPLARHYLNGYKYIIAVAPFLALIMLPWALWLPESSRWLMANGYYKQAKKELLRGAKWNGRQNDPLIENKIVILNRKINIEREKQERDTNKTSYLLLFSSWPLVRDTIVLSICTFLSHLFYYSLTINFSYFGDVSIDTNFIISGLGEFIGCILGASMTKYLPRRMCVFLFLSALGLSFAIQSLVNTNIFPSINTRFVSTALNAIGTTSSLTSIFVILIINQEVYPTVIRQTGSGLVNTIAETGSAVAPFLVNLTKTIGFVASSALFALMSFMAALSIHFLTETGGTELNDTVNQDINNKVLHRGSVFSRSSQNSSSLRANIHKINQDRNSSPAANNNTGMKQSCITLDRLDNIIYWPQRSNKINGE